MIFNTIDTKEQLSHALQYMRYPQQKTSKYPHPLGLRGYGPGNAVFAWGISSAEYQRRADLWPLNPEGDLLAIAMVETAAALKNVNEIASVPGWVRRSSSARRRFASVARRAWRCARGGSGEADNSTSVPEAQRRLWDYRNRSGRSRQAAQRGLEDDQKRAVTAVRGINAGSSLMAALEATGKVTQAVRPLHGDIVGG